MLIIGFIIGLVIGLSVAALIRLAEKESISGWENSCTGDCNQGRDCNCVMEKKK